MSERYLIIFVKNPVMGRVKTRLAQSVGDMKALGVYIKLLEHTQDVSRGANCVKGVYYSDRIATKDCWEKGVYEKYIQEGSDLGERMKNAFRHAFDMEYKKVVIIGSDCFEITEKHINDAFEVLENKDIVLGPSTDGGYYLLGMSKMVPSLFDNKNWSTSSVLAETIGSITQENMSYKLLSELTDIDTIEDLEKFNLHEN